MKSAAFVCLKVKSMLINMLLLTVDSFVVMSPTVITVDLLVIIVDSLVVTVGDSYNCGFACYNCRQQL